MEIIKKIANKQDFYNYPTPTIAFFGDSVTHGCFECYEREKGVIDTYYEIKNGYPTRVKEQLNELYPASHINIINAGLSGDTATNALNRLERDILAYHPDLCVVSFQLNYSMSGIDGLEKYKQSLDKIFKELKQRNIEVIFLTENTMCTYVSPKLDNDLLKAIAAQSAEIENSGVAKRYRDAALEVCKNNNVKVCDIYAIWDEMRKNGKDVTDLLSNKINHPNREFHHVIAKELIKVMCEE